MTSQAHCVVTLGTGSGSRVSNKLWAYGKERWS